MLNLFALTNSPAERIVRFPLDQSVQQDLTNYFSSQEQDFNDVAVEEIAFDGKYKPDTDEVLVIDDFDDIEFLSEAIRNPLAVPEAQPNPDFFKTIKALFAGYVNPNDEVVVLIQAFDKRRILSTSGLSIFHANNVYRKIEGVGLTIGTKLTAVLTGARLRFQSFHMLRQIFDLTQYYREATDEDIREFSNIPAIQVQDLTALIAISDNWVRRKFSLIQQSGILDATPIADIKAVAVEFNIPVDFVLANAVEVIRLPQNKRDLKTVLRFLDEDYYKSPLSNSQYLTNSKRLIS